MTISHHACFVLDSQGKRCGQMARVRKTYHGEYELYRFPKSVSWVVIYVCRKHAEEIA